MPRLLQALHVPGDIGIGESEDIEGIADAVEIASLACQGQGAVQGTVRFFSSPELYMGHGQRPIGAALTNQIAQSMKGRDRPFRIGDAGIDVTHA